MPANICVHCTTPHRCSNGYSCQRERTRWRIPLAAGPTHQPPDPHGFGMLAPILGIGVYALILIIVMTRYTH